MVGVWTATNSEGFPAPAALGADVVVLAVRAGELRVLVVEGAHGLALPGGLVGAGEDPADTAARKLAEKTGLTGHPLEQLGAFAAPGRDPRGWIPTIAHLALIPGDVEADARWLPARGHPPLTFDHDAILAAAIDRVEGKLWWSNVAVGALPGSFSLSDAREVYGAIAQVAYDPATFARDLRSTGLIEPTGEQRAGGPGRPAALFRFCTREPAWGAGRRKRVRT